MQSKKFQFNVTRGEEGRETIRAVFNFKTFYSENWSQHLITSLCNSSRHWKKYLKVPVGAGGDLKRNTGHRSNSEARLLDRFMANIPK